MKKPIYSPYYFKRNMTLSVIVVVLCALLLVGIFSFFVYDSQLSIAEQSILDTNLNCYNQAESALDNATRICLFFATYKSISPVFQSQETNINLQQATLKEEMRTFISCNDFLAGITVDTDNYTLTHGAVAEGRFSPESEYKSFKVSYLVENNWTNILRISYVSESMDFYSVNVDIYTNYLSNLYFDPDTYCYAPDGRLIMCADTYLLGSNISDVVGLSLEELSNGAPQGYIQASQQLAQSDFTIVTLKNKQTVLPSVILTTLLFLAISVLVFAFLIPILYVLLKRFYQPIYKVMDVFKFYLPKNDTFIEDDIKFISKCVNDPSMGSVTQSAVLQIRKSQLHTLQSQISPHFLGNSLDIISWKAVDALGIDNPISESLGILSLFLTDSYEHTSMFYTISDEIDRTQEYIRLAQYCFIKNLQVDWDVDPTILDYSIISITLQPLLENSIVHGFIYPENKANAKISISILPVDDDIEIVLKDNGCGMPKKTLQEIQSALSSEDQIKHHIGLKNTHLKLKLLYGERYGITDISSSEEGTQIKLLLPQYHYPNRTPSPPPR